MQKVKHYTQVDHFIYDNGVIYCYAGDTLFRINSFSFYAVPEESDLEPYVELYLPGIGRWWQILRGKWRTAEKR